jgi:hypothetical protein
MNLVDEMVAARWRQQRVWVTQTAALDLEMDSQRVDMAEHQVNNAPLGITEPARIALAFTAMANQEKTLELLLRYETSFSRMHDRAMKALYRLRAEEDLRNDPKPVQPAPGSPVPPPDGSSIERQSVPPEPVETNPAAVYVIGGSNRKPKSETWGPTGGGRPRQ